MLIEHNLFGSTDKVADAINLLRQHEPPEGYYLCFSGGKDSVVIYDLAVRAGVKFDAHHNITTVEPPELMQFIKREYPLVANNHPTTTMHKLIVKHKIPPLRTARYCCEALKERGGNGRVKITGIRSEESPRRAKRGQVEDNRHGGLFVHVIKDWAAADVWQYIRENNLPYCRLYDEGFQRIGCVLCPFQNFSAVQRDMERFPAIVDYYRRACRTSFKVNRDWYRSRAQTAKHKSGEWTSGDDMFNWWIQNRRGRYVAEDCNSIPLFSEDDGWIL